MESGRHETQVMAELAGLALAHREYPDLLGAALDLIVDVLPGPLLALTVDEGEESGFYSRAAASADPLWTDDVARQVADMHRHARPHVVAERAPVQRLSSPPAWVVSVPAHTRAGRGCVLTLAAPAPLRLRAPEERRLFRYARQLLLVLDHALTRRELDRLNTTDDVTGLLNHRHLLQVLESELRRHRYAGRQLALVLIDVEGLDGINQAYGHRYGDHILAKLAGLLETVVRPIDVVGRCGMDEFAVVLPEADDDGAADLVNRVREQLLGLGFAGGTVELGVGVAHAKPDEAVSAEALVQRAEQALDETKRQERGWNALLHVGRRSVL